jgi:hypothetical protein
MYSLSHKILGLPTRDSPQKGHYDRELHETHRADTPTDQELNIQIVRNILVELAFEGLSVKNAELADILKEAHNCVPDCMAAEIIRELSVVPPHFREIALGGVVDPVEHFGGRGGAKKRLHMLAVVKEAIPGIDVERSVQRFTAFAAGEIIKLGFADEDGLIEKDE